MADGASIATGVKRSVQNPAPFGDCKRCDKAGFPILPMRFAYTARSASAEAGSASLSGQDYTFRAGVLAMRMLSQGFLYVLDERGGGTWRAFQVSNEGSLSEFTVANKPEPVEPQCGRSDHAVRSAAFSIPDPKNAKRVWLAYFSVWQTEHQLQLYDAALLGKAMPARFEEDPQVELKNLKGRFQEFSVPDLMTGVKAGAVSHRQADALGADLGVVRDHAPEFGGRHSLYVDSVTPGADRSGLATAVAQRMAGMHEGGGVAVYLHDPIGIALEIRHLATLKRLKIEAINQKFRRKIAVKRLIEQIGASWKAGGSDKAQEWAEDYFDKIDASKIASFDREYAAEIGQLPSILNGLCDDGGNFQQAWALRNCLKHDFDVADAASTMAMVCQAATVLGGGGLCDIDRGHAIKEFEKPVEDNLWYWAITGGQRSLLTVLAEDKQADVQGIIKSSYSVFDAWVFENQGFMSQLHAQMTGAAAASAGGSADRVRIATFRSALFIEEALRNLITGAQGLLTDVKLAAYKNLRVFAVAGALWFRTAVQPVVQEVTVADFIRDNKESAWGHSLESRLQRSVDAEGGKRSAINLADVTDELGEAGRKKIPLLRIHWGEVIELESLTGERARVVSQEANRRIRRAAGKTGAGKAGGRRGGNFAKAPLGAAMDKAYEQLRRQALIEQAADKAKRELAAETARINRARVQGASVPAVASPAALAGAPHATSGGWSTKTIAVLKNGAAAGTLAVWAMGFQAVALAASLKECEDKPSSAAYAKISASLLGFVGAGLEASGAMMALRAYLTARTTGTLVRAATATAGAGGILGGAAGIIVGVMTIRDARDLKDAGDRDAADAMQIAGILLTISGAATAGGGMMLLGMSLYGGPIVWAIVAVGAAIAGLYFLVVAEEKRDNPLQVWLRSCCFGIKPTYATEKEEADVLEKLFVIPFAVTGIWRTGASVLGYTFGGTVDVLIDAPDVMEGKGWLEHRIELQMTDGRVLTASSSRLLSADLRAGLVDPQRFSEGLEHQNRGLSAPTSGGANLRRSETGGVMWRIIYVNDSLKSVKVTARLWPDKSSNPGLVLPSGEGIVQLITAER